MSVTRPDLEASLRDGLAAGFALEPAGRDAFHVLTPYVLPDGDGLAIVLERQVDGWVLTDRGHTFMHLSYSIDTDQIKGGNRGRIIADALSSFGVDDIGGELRIEVPDTGALAGALYDFVQALLKVSDVTFLSREIVRSTFLDDVRRLLTDIVPSGMIERDWTDPQHDPKRLYPVDYRIDAPVRPVVVFALPTETHVKDATIALAAFERWGINSLAVGIFEDSEELAPRSVARFMDVADRPFSNLEGNRDRIAKLLTSALEGQPV